MLSRLLIASLWLPTGKWLTSWLLFVMSYCDFVPFPCGILGHVWYLIVLIPDLCHFLHEHSCKTVDYNAEVFWVVWSHGLELHSAF